MRLDKDKAGGTNLVWTRGQALARLAATALLAWPVVGGNAGELTRYESSQVHMGMDFRVVFYADDPNVANRALEAVWRRIAELDSVFSDYRADSELMRAVAAASAGERPVLGEDLWTVLSRSQQLSADSNGAFDVTVGPLTRLWRRARRQRQAPDAAELATARAAVGWRCLELNAMDRSMQLARPGMRIDLGGIAVGYTVDQALRVLREQGISRALVDGSGDIAVWDPPPEAGGWRIELDTLAEDVAPRPLLLCRAAITTASDAAQHVEIGGVRYSHVIDPRLGRPLTVSRSVTVVAPDCFTADGLDTALSVMDINAGLALVEQTRDAAALIVAATAKGPHVHQSARWNSCTRAPGAIAGPSVEAP